MPRLYRAAITFAMDFPIAIVTFDLGWRVFDRITPGPPMTWSLLLTEATVLSSVMAALAYAGILWGNGPTEPEPRM